MRTARRVPGSDVRAMASAAGIASTVATSDETVPSPRLSQNALMKRGLSRMAANQRSDSRSVGSEMYPSGVNATTQTISSGAKMNPIKSAWKISATGLF